jgi:membrane protein involved in colicin uptake
MSQETQIGNLGGGISEEDSKLVDSILNDLNSHQEERPRQMQQRQEPQQQQQMQQQMQEQQQPQQIPRDQNGNELTPEQIKQIQMQRQMAMQQQQLMAQQQQMQQQQQMAQQQVQTIDKDEKESNLMPSNSNDLIDNIKNESKSIILIILLSIILNLEQVDNLFKLQPGLFICENGSLNIQAIFIKALVIGAIYYVAKLFLL